jgi:hypothetical protein
MGKKKLLKRFEKELLGQHGCAACKDRYADTCTLTERDVKQFVIASTGPGTPQVRPYGCPKLKEEY